MDTSQALDLSKENIQPLLHGRNTDKLITALQVNSNFQLQQELKRHREDFEFKIRLYKGDDPLQLRFEYVQWLEQSYPNLGPETNIVPFLEETLIELKNVEQYKQDPRFVSLVIKYIETQPNPLEIYNVVYSENIGTKLAMFYKAWASKLDTYGDIKQANHVFQLGLDIQAQPLEELEDAQMNFQLSVGRRFLMGGPTEEAQPPLTQESAVPQRQVLGKLKKVTPGMTRLRIGDTGRLSQHPDSKKPLQNTTTGLNVYTDPCEHENNYVKEPSMQNSHFKIKAATMHKENTESPGVWTKKSTKKFATPVPVHPCTPSFPIHIDEGFEDQNVTSVKMSSALKVKKQVDEQGNHHTTGLFDSAPTGKEGYMFCKNKIFLGKSELQIEEFRGAQYRMEKYGCLLPPTTPQPQVSDNVKEGAGTFHQKTKAHKEDDIPVCIAEPVDKTKVPMYSKQQVYIGGNKEIQLEELRAVQYRKKVKNNPALWTEEIPVCIPCFSDKTRCMYPKSQIYIGNNKEVQLEEIRATQYKARKLAARKSQAIIAPSKSFDEVENCPSSHLGKVASFAVYSDDSPKVSKVSGANKSQNVMSHSKVLTFSSSDDSLEKNSSESAKKLELLDSPLQTPPRKPDLVEDVPRKVYNLFDDIWKSPAVACTKPQEQDPRLDVSEFTVHTKEAFKLVDDWWSSPSSDQSAPPKLAEQKNTEVTFKKPVSIKKAPAPSTTPFKIFSEEEPAPAPPKTPGFQIFTDEELGLGNSVPKPVGIEPQTPGFEIFNDEELFTDEEISDSESARILPPPKTPKFPVFCDEDKTPKFNIYSDDGDDPAEQLSCKARPEGSSKTPSFNVFCDEPSSAAPKQSQKKSLVPFNNHDCENIIPNHSHYEQDLLEEDDLATPLGDEDRLPSALPYVAPAMDLDRQPLGHEFKENFPPGDQSKSTKKSLESRRQMNGYLVPSSVPINVLEEEEEEEYEDEITDMTCNTRAFNFALPSSTSTPFCSGNMRGNGAGNYEVNGSYLQDPAPSTGLNLSYKTQCENLSVILEASKEKSSSSSGSSGYSGVSGAPSSYLNSCEKKPPMHHPVYEDNATSGLEVCVASLNMNQTKIDPFDKKVIDDLLNYKVQFPLARHRVGYESFFSELQSLKVNSHTSLGNTEYTILKELGKGAYARVLMGKTSSDSKVALKQQKPACVWEWYISKEIENRLKASSPALAYFVLPHHIYVFKNSSVLAAPWAKFGNLLDLVNVYKIKKGKSLNIQACLKLNLEMAQALHALHKINIIHGDIKPDNFVICNFMRSGLPTLQLIDYGRSIDMSLFPPGTTFNTVVTTDGFQCTEMKENRDWTYHTDVYGLAGTMCCTLLGKYMNTIKRGSKWCLADTIPRYLSRDLMEPIFETLLNLPALYNLKILDTIIQDLERAFKLSLAHSDEGLQNVDDILTQLKL